MIYDNGSCKKRQGRELHALEIKEKVYFEVLIFETKMIIEAYARTNVYAAFGLH